MYTKCIYAILGYLKYTRNQEFNLELEITMDISSSLGGIRWVVVCCGASDLLDLIAPSVVVDTTV